MASNEPNDYQVVLTKQTKKFLSVIPKNYYRILSKHLLNLEHDPFPQGSIKLKGSENEYRLRVGVYRFYILLNTIN